MQHARSSGGAGLARDRPHAKAGLFVSSHCHVLLALWDGQESGRLGGTAQVVRFHLRRSFVSTCMETPWARWTAATPQRTCSGLTTRT